MRHLPTAVLLALGLGFATCGGSSSSTESEKAPAPVLKQQEEPKVVSACSLLTAEEAAAILGEPVEKPSESATGSTVSNCNWMTGSSTSVGILLRRASSKAEAERVYQQAHQQSKSVSGVDPEDISGLGDKAYWAGGHINQLNVFKGNYWLIIMANKGNGADSLAAAKAVAGKALAKLS